jgi:hypothetical protein
MAKPLGPKSRLIREAIKAHLNMGNTELAELINASDARKEDRLEVTANDIAQQKTALKKTGFVVASVAKKRGRPQRPASTPAPAETVHAVTRSVPAPAGASPVDLIDKTFALAEECGGIEQLKRLVNRLAGK